MTERVEWEVAKIGLCISENKTKIMRIGYVDGNHNGVPLMTGHHQIEEIDEFTYLGSIMANDGDAERDIACQIGKALAVFQRLKLIRAGRAISIKIKVCLFNSIVIPSAIYAAETWKTSAKITRKLNVFQL
uniref:Reverse transcriptase domain-containing protein n=1 Tax=Octopus bimaculoides TaxID=37653 RepID=A0A0L8IDM2_OCTBM